MSDQPVPPASDPGLPPEPVVQSDPRPPSGRDAAVTAIICGLLGPVAIIGLIFGIVAWRREIHPGRGESKKLAITGTILSACMLSTCVGVFTCLTVTLRQDVQRRMQNSESQYVKDLSVAVKAYAAANRDELPPAGADWKSLLKAAADPKSPSYWASDWFVDRLVYIPPVKPLAQAAQPPPAVIFIVDHITGSRFNWKVVLYADGNVAVLKESDWGPLDGLRTSDGTTYNLPGGVRSK